MRLEMMLVKGVGLNLLQKWQIVSSNESWGRIFSVILRTVILTMTATIIQEALLCTCEKTYTYHLLSVDFLMIPSVSTDARIFIMLDSISTVPQLENKREPV